MWIRGSKSDPFVLVLGASLERQGGRLGLEFEPWEDGGGFSELVSGGQPSPAQGSEIVRLQLTDDFLTRCWNDRADQECQQPHGLREGIKNRVQ